jgi:hypothetical protein
VFLEKPEYKKMVYAVFGTNILKLWSELNENPFFETVEMLREVARNRDDLKDLDRNNIAEIHLFFDFEGHLPEKTLDAHCDIIYKMLSFFDEETDQGKLWLSYPMAEALKHTYKDITKCFDCIQNIDENTKYKEKVGKIIDFQHRRDYTRNHWRHIIAINALKAMCLVTCSYSIPTYKDVSSVLNPLRIFAAQKERFILLNAHVVVLSAFPFFLLYYFESDKLYDEIHFDAFDKACRFKHIVGNETIPKEDHE